MIFRWNPNEEMTRMEQLMRKMFEPTQPAEERARLTRPAWIPAVDAWESDKGYHLAFDVPGVAKEDITIEVEGDQLVVKGERKVDESINYLRKERVFGNFYRAFTLEAPIQQESIKASFKNGVLEVFLPKMEEVKPKQIQIAIEGE